MHRFLFVATTVGMAMACKHHDRQREVAAATPAPSDPQCNQLPFANESPIAEASAARWLLVDGTPAIFIVSDSGNNGAYELLDPNTGTVRENGLLPLGTGASDDLEGISSQGDKLYGLNSSGWMRVWRRDAEHHAYALVDGPYPIGEVGKGKPACDGMKVNCGPNYEGLCLQPTVDSHDDGCVGFAASKQNGNLVCLVAQGAQLRADPTRAIAVTRPQALADCDISPDGTTLWAGSNVFEGGRVFRVDGWKTPAQAKAVSFAYMPIGNAEGLAVDPSGDFYRFSDSNSAPSLQAKFRCSSANR